MILCCSRGVGRAYVLDAHCWSLRPRSIHLPRDSSLREPLNTVLSRLRDTGIVDKMVSDEMLAVGRLHKARVY